MCTLVVTHTTTLRDQWVEEVEKVFGIKPGVVGGGELNISPIITIANIQTLRKHSKTLANKFGTIFIDECHRAPSASFTQCLNDFRARYKIGLSGTPERKDLKHQVFDDYFTSNRYIAPLENRMEPDVHIMNTDFELSSNPMMPWALKINEILNSEDYVVKIADLVNIYTAAGHKVLVVADRTEFLCTCAGIVDNAICVTGETPMGDRKGLIEQIKTGDATSLFGTMSIFSEGISINQLSCLILATQTNNRPLLKQVSARVLRLMPGKKKPVIVDIVMKGTTATKQSRTRQGVYISEGWKMEHFNV